MRVGRQVHHNLIELVRIRPGHSKDQQRADLGSEPGRLDVDSSGNKAQSAANQDKRQCRVGRHTALMRRLDRDLMLPKQFIDTEIDIGEILQQCQAAKRHDDDTHDGDETSLATHEQHQPQSAQDKVKGGVVLHGGIVWKDLYEDRLMGHPPDHDREAQTGHQATRHVYGGRIQPREFGDKNAELTI